MQFNLITALSGAPVRTQGGRPVRILAHVPEAVPEERVVCLIGSNIETYSEQGMYLPNGEPSTWDLTTKDIS